MNSDITDQAATAAPVSERTDFARMRGPGRLFHKIAVDLDRAWAVCRLTGCERRVLQYVREHTWGVSALKKTEPQPCRVNASFLGPVWRVSRQRITEALNDLTRDGLLVSDGGRYSIGKHAPSWRNGRLTPSDLEYAIHGEPEDCTEIRARQTERKSMQVCTKKRSGHARESVQGMQGNPCIAGRKSVHVRPAAYRNAGASEDSQKTPEDNSNSRAGGFHPEELETPSRPVERHEGLLASDELPPAPGPAGPLPPPAPPGEDDRLALWCKAEVDRVYPDNEMHGEAIFRGVRQWRLAGVDRHVIAAFVADACGVSFRSIRTDVPRFVGDKIRRYRPEEGHPVVPAEWAPAVAVPEFFRGSEEFRAKRREAEARRRERVAREGYPVGPKGPEERARAEEWRREHSRRVREMALEARAS